ncbi:MAG TPA: ABC transporter substrate binding protein [Leptospiraceae bacterium]|nr:ABC transporter substrate binding protein [Leptospiraceae bacterium]HMY65371.1 ABC transporter substrate binding protein [Leptospiraceae bacterium]HMZ59759.1 ABC transporter substrate binding protein [Leptospiraceae bacterium]HNF16421.1 ABC transporter substrate binding protein [Leptospiraceae bacterium]HNM03780.1 ABC transporter substrate binding protein [Leptospiraceae bacterium]
MKTALFIILIFFSDAAGAETESLPVEVLLSSNNSIYLSILRNIQSVFSGRLNFQYMQSMNEAELKDFFYRTENRGAKLLIALGNQAALAAKENLKNTPVLYSLVNSPRALGFNSSSNTCGIHIDVPVEQFFSTLKEIRPDAKRVAAFYSGNAGEMLVNEADYADSHFGILFQKIKIEKNEFSEKLNELKGRADAFYMVPDSVYTQENFEILSRFAKENRIILMTQIPFIVNVGTAFSITPYYARAGSMIGEMANEIFAGRLECTGGYASAVREFSFNLNREYAEESGTVIPENILKRAENSRLLSEGISHFEKGNLEISSLVMEKILKADPANTTAVYYKNAINFRLNGEKIQELFAKAKKYRDEKNYRNERDAFSRILVLQPGDPEAKQGIQKSLQAESEAERLEGERLEAGKQVFPAIRKYLNSIRILESNAKSRNSLARIREKEIKNIPLYIRTGKGYYEQRKYGQAEELFQNVLLADPDNKNAKEYLRLSADKKTAMLKYEECLKTSDKKCHLLWTR